jgi:hypothetical protein
MGARIGAEREGEGEGEGEGERREGGRREKEAYSELVDDQTRAWVIE